MTLEEYIEERRKRVDNMTLAQARYLIAKSLSHSDMELEFDKAVQMLLDCADEKINNHWIPVSERLPKEEQNSYWICTDTGYQCECRWTNMNLFMSHETTDWHWNTLDIPQYTKVVAWKSLPQPYKAENEGKK